MRKLVQGISDTFFRYLRGMREDYKTRGFTMDWRLVFWLIVAMLAASVGLAVVDMLTGTGP